MAGISLEYLANILADSYTTIGSHVRALLQENWKNSKNLRHHVARGGADFWAAGDVFKNLWFSKMAHRVSVIRYVLSYSFKENYVLRLYPVQPVNISMLHLAHYTFQRRKDLVPSSGKTVHLAKINARRSPELTTRVIIYQATQDLKRVVHSR